MLEDVEGGCEASNTPQERGVRLTDFVAYMPTHTYIYTPCRETWAGKSVNARVPWETINGKKVAPTTLLDRKRPVEQLTWCPGEPMLIRDKLVVDGGWIHRLDVTCFNLYRPPRIELGDAGKAGPWIEHVHTVYGEEDATHIIMWLAQRVQRPAEKINHALVLGGAQGIGKDTLLEPVKHAVGAWNMHEVSPGHLLGRFNSFVKSVILRVNEARDLGGIDRFKLYDHTKIYNASPPDVLRCDEKHLREHYVFNCMGFLITTNHKTDGIYLPSDDRRHFVAWSCKTKDDFTVEYWQRLWDWYEAGGYGHVAAYLAGLDLSGFNPKAPPPKTAAFWDIVSANDAPEDGELADVLDDMGAPAAVALPQIMSKATGAAAEWLLDRRNRRAIPHRMERAGYVAVRNPTTKDGRWKVQGANVVVYAKADLDLRQQMAAAAAVARP
jgi:Family of unknown function (DUF5906)